MDRFMPAFQLKRYSKFQKQQQYDEGS